MDLVVYSQTYGTRTTKRQLELDECLRHNLNHPGISRMVLFCESDAPALPEGTVLVEVAASNERITTAEWLRWVKRQNSGIGLLLNAEIYLDEGLEHLKASFNTPEAFVALTRYNPGHADFHLNDYPQWTQDTRGVRANTETHVTTDLAHKGISDLSTSTSISVNKIIIERKPEACRPCPPERRGVLEPC